VQDATSSSAVKTGSFDRPATEVLRQRSARPGWPKRSRAELAEFPAKHVDGKTVRAGAGWVSQRELPEADGGGTTGIGPGRRASPRLCATGGAGR